jgi:hypothetical protein
MEHLMSIGTGRRLMKLMGYLLADDEPAIKVREQMKTLRD